MEEVIRAKEGIKGECPCLSQEIKQYLRRSIVPRGIRGTVEKASSSGPLERFQRP